MTSFCGYVAILGRANAGKSTLVNALVGQKVIGVSRKPQTTRNKILGIATEGDAQFLLLDTPGLHKTRGQGQMNRIMHKESMGSLADAHVVCYLIDIKDGVTAEDRKLIGQIRAETKAPLFLCYSKIDKVMKFVIKDRLAELKAAIHEDGIEAYALIVTAKRLASLDALKAALKPHLPESPFLFPADDLTDRSTKFVMTELIREAIFRSVGEEIPYQTAVVIEELNLAPRKNAPCEIRALIVAARNSQKGIIIGKGGSKIKELGTLARLNLEQFLDQKVFLDLSVKVQDRWVDDAQEIGHLLEIQP